MAILKRQRADGTYEFIEFYGKFVRLEETFTATANNTSTILIQNSYSKTADNISVFFKGLRLTENESYTISPDSRNVILKDWVLKTGEKIDIEIFKNASNVDNLTSGSQLEDLSVDKHKLSQALQEEINKTNNELSDVNRETAILSSGVNIIKSNNSSPVDIQLFGNTLTSLSNSDMKSETKYVLADKMTKIKEADGTVHTGVSKFTTKNYFSSTATFAGKVNGSIVENPHVLKGAKAGTSLISPSDFTYEGIASDYNAVSTIGGELSIMAFTNVNNERSQHLFSFNLIEEVERNICKIPRTTTAEKVQWLKDNILRITCDWHGFGSSPTGNKATLTGYGINSWWSEQYRKSHTSSTVTKLSVTMSNTSDVDSNGFVYFTAYAEISNGTVMSRLSTDYVELIVELKTTAQLDTKPALIRVASFKGKVSNSTIENPHKFSYKRASTLDNPPSYNQFILQSDIDSITKLDNNVKTIAGTLDTEHMSQQVFSFNLIEEIERNLGKIPGSTTTDKAKWIRNNLENINFNWHGYGSSATGNKANIANWRADVSQWSTPTSHALSSVSKITQVVASILMPYRIDTNGFIHFLAYAEPSNGATASIINTDYVELEIELKPTAVLNSSNVALYEVSTDEYAKILADWDENTVLTRYPKIENAQHLQGISLVADGVNLLPPFTEWTLHANAKVVSPYKLELNAVKDWEMSTVLVNLKPNQKYTLSFDESVDRVRIYDGTTTSAGVLWSADDFGKTRTFTTKGEKVLFLFSNRVAGKFTFKNPILTLGATAKPFVPRSQSSLFADVKLGEIGTTKDMLYKDDGRWLLRKAIEKDVELDGGLGWAMYILHTGSKSVKVPISSNINQTVIGVKYNGSVLKSILFSPEITDNIYMHSDGNAYANIPNVNTGFSDAYTPTTDEIKAYFNGWQVKTANSANKPTAWQSIVDSSDAPTQTLAYVSANKAPNYTPYKLSYILTTPQIIDVTDKVEGDILVNGLTQIEVNSGVIVREKANVKVRTSDGRAYINISDVGSLNNNIPVGSKSNHEISKVLSVYKNGIKDNWEIINNQLIANGLEYAITKNFDPTAEYTVTYQALDRHQITTNVTDVKVAYANNIRSALDDTIVKVSDIATDVSLNIKSIVELYKRVRQLEGV